MVKFLNSLQTKLTISFIILILVISSLTFFYTFNETKSALKETMRDELKAVAAATATQMDGDKVAMLKAGDEGTPEFLSIRDQLWAVQNSNPDIKYVYIMALNGDEVQFVVDGSYGKEDDAAMIGDVYDEAPEDLINGFTAPSADREFTTDEWGTYLSGYAPVYDSKGNSVGLVGVDMSSDRVIEKQNFIGYTIYIIVGLAILIAGAMIAFFSKTIIQDIKKLNENANKISMGDTNVMVDVKRNDEIGELADSFGRMVASLKIMMDTSYNEK
ncbi:HAMP domain-containing protein [Methanocella sp. CWC-04]|uniref:histidine kinase n=1 Tax=Methanooceanicella nereidis TaxID=2052831 RepID=A0AAP2RBL1_9EURY|nr:HAMP domain-containing protein [Methanocella sp. CWC-04]MCD1293630.1 HAMP domain-containing protein [Methanocella sp. CWC-04]